MCWVQDASGDSDLWDLAVTESREAAQRHGSPSPFASRSLLGSFDMEARQPSSSTNPFISLALFKDNASTGIVASASTCVFLNLLGYAAACCQTEFYLLMGTVNDHSR